MSSAFAGLGHTICAQVTFELARLEPRVFTPVQRREMNQQKANTTGREKNGGALIYVVDDEPMLLELAVVVLEPIGYVVKTFRDPKAALEAFGKAETPPALLITDYAMHMMNGMELMSACRGINPVQKILMISGTVDEKIFRTAPCKPNRFLAKPYQAKQLVEAVKSLLAA